MNIFEWNYRSECLFPWYSNFWKGPVIASILKQIIELFQFTINFLCLKMKAGVFLCVYTDKSIIKLNTGLWFLDLTICKNTQWLSFKWKKIWCFCFRTSHLQGTTKHLPSENIVHLLCAPLSSIQVEWTLCKHKVNVLNLLFNLCETPPVIRYYSVMQVHLQYFRFLQCICPFPVLVNHKVQSCKKECRISQKFRLQRRKWTPSGAALRMSAAVSSPSH